MMALSVLLVLLMSPELGTAQQQSPAAFLSILYTGMAEANIEPCACSGQNLGGVVSRSLEIENVRSEGIPTLLLESGQAFASGTELDRARTEFYLEMLDRMGYDAMNIATQDLVLGPEFL
ncbi:MAG TPA: hypothetical protein PKH07_19120, partial [bacterium]|nr:hypothetical protein [bacterium]